MTIKDNVFGYTHDGKEVRLYRMQDGDFSVSVLSLGGIIQSLVVPDRLGRQVDVVLGFDHVADYEKQNCYIGATIGRCANRMRTENIVLNDKKAFLAKNDKGYCHLHGGISGFNQKIWQATVLKDRLVLKYTSPDGEEGYPGTLCASITYQLKDGVLTLHYQAETDQDTLCNLTNHSYFNLAGHQSGSVGLQSIQLAAHAYTPIEEHGLPTGNIELLNETPLFLQKERFFSELWNTPFSQIEMAGGLDHNYLIDGTGLRWVARAWSEKTGVTLDVQTDMPGLQLYSGNYLDHTLPKGKGGVEYEKRCGFCIETQYPPDAIHFENFPQPILRCGETYDHITAFQFGIK